MSSAKFIKTKTVKTPEYANRFAAGIDFYIPEGENFTIMPGESVVINSGIAIELPVEKALLAVNKSGRGRSGLIVGACLIDCDYRGPIHLNLWNVSKRRIRIFAGEKLVQFIYIDAPQLKLIETDQLSVTIRGDGAFGSTGLS